VAARRLRPVQEHQLIEIVPDAQEQPLIARRPIGGKDEPGQQPARAVRDRDRIRQTQIVFGSDGRQMGKIERQGSDP
jgi:hypothetical protein